MNTTILKTESKNFTYTDDDISDIVHKMFRIRRKIVGNDNLTARNYISGCLPQTRSIVERLQEGQEVKLKIPKNAMVGITTSKNITDFENKIIDYIEKKLKIKLITTTH